ncbi:hypothetical protein Shyd_72690 [Streptomyces hydrogenans]|uniref:Uncharacterized protein n=1 Tax=Streptomyces hydrogenans TaxID=1873719 RepID=A0ABQ3PLJ5_9ACTN|nr:hypothetical protein Shyd_72690 [Streptomyces hydrogenans]
MVKEMEGVERDGQPHGDGCRAEGAGAPRGGRGRFGAGRAGGAQCHPKLSAEREEVLKDLLPVAGAGWVACQRGWMASGWPRRAVTRVLTVAPVGGLGALEGGR